MNPKRGEVVTVAASGDFGKPHPAVVVRSDVFPERHASMIVCQMTSTQKKDAGRAWFLVEVEVPPTDEELTAHGFTYRLRRKKLREVFRREGRYLLRSNMTGEDPAELWRHLVLARHTQPSRDHELLLRQLDLELPKQPATKLLS